MILYGVNIKQQLKRVERFAKYKSQRPLEITLMSSRN